MVLLATLAFSQASVVLAACGLDRAALAQALSGEMHECCDTEQPANNVMPMTANSCLGEGTSDLQAPAAGLATVVGLANSPVLFVALAPGDSRASARLSVPPPKGIPPRILLHSFLI